MRVRTRVQVSLSDTEVEEKDLGYPFLDDINDDHDEGGTMKAKVAAAASDLQLPLGVVANAGYLYIRTQASDPNDTPITLTFKLNDVGNDAFSVTPMGNTRKGIFLLSTTGVTALYVSNAGTVDMDVIYSVAGD